MKTVYIKGEEFKLISEVVSGMKNYSEVKCGSGKVKAVHKSMIYPTCAESVAYKVRALEKELETITQRQPVIEKEIKELKK